MKPLSQRDAFWNAIYDLAKADRRIILVSADMGAPSLDRIRRDLAAQFVNVGIAEQNAITVAGGLALEGKLPYTFAIGPFMSLRCLEQIRLACGMMRLPVNIVGVGAGFGYEVAGPTHHLVEDLSALRAVPHLIIHTFSDSRMAAGVARLSHARHAPRYLRMDRMVLPDLYAPDADFSAGLAVFGSPAENLIVACGSMTHAALDLARRLGRGRRKIAVMDLHTLPINRKLFLASLRGVKRLLSLEEHFLSGGLGSAVAELLVDEGVAVKFRRLGVPIEQGFCYRYGGREDLRRFYGLGERDLERKAAAFFR